MPNVDVVPKLELHLHSFITFKLSKGVLFYILKPLKVNKNRNDFMKTTFGPKSNVIIVLLYSRAEILTIITLLFGPNCVFIKSFLFLLTFTQDIRAGKKVFEILGRFFLFGLLCFCQYSTLCQPFFIVRHKTKCTRRKLGSKTQSFTNKLKVS